MPELDLEQALRDLPRPSFKQRLRELMQPQTITPYIVVGPVDSVIDFTKEVLGASELVRSTGSAGGTHCEVRIGDSKLMIGGGPQFSDEAMPTMLHVYVDDVDAVYRRAVDAGAKGIMPPTEQVYGDRDSMVEDAGGNLWCFATSHGAAYKPVGLRDVTLYLHPYGAPQLAEFMSAAFGVEMLETFNAPDGSLSHAKLRLGNTIIEMGEAHGQWTPQPTMLYVSVADVDTAYERALAAGAKAFKPPADQPYGARVAAVEDRGGNQWWLASALR
jgi:PhnB protein